MQAFVDARYEYHWTPLLGSLVGHLNRIGAAQPSYVIGAATGISYRPPEDAGLPDSLRGGLSALGVAAQVIDVAGPNRVQRFLTRRRIRNELRADRPATVYGVGVSAFGPTFGLIVGVDDARRAWRREGPMTEQVSPWLSESEFKNVDPLIVVSARRAADPDPDVLRRAAAAALAEHAPLARAGLGRRVEVYGSDQSLDPQRHAHEVQALAANWGEAAAFWREHPHPRFSAVSREMAVTLSRYATLFPYPMGGQPNHPGVRHTAVHMLHEAADLLDAAH